MQRYGLLFILMAGSGIIGGFISTRVVNLTAAGAQPAAQSTPVLQAERFEIVEKNGKHRGWLGLTPHGNTSLGFYDQDGHIAVTLSVTPDRTTGLTLVNKEGNRRAGLELSAGDAPTLELYDKDKKCRVKLAVAEDGEPQVWLYDAKEIPRVAVGVSSDGSATMGIADSNRKETISFNIEANGNPHLDLTDQDGKTRAILGYAEPNIFPSGPWTKQLVPSLMLYGANGQVIGEVP